MEKITIWYIIVGFSVFAGSCSQLLLKKSAMTSHQSWLSSILNWRVILAYAIFFCSLPVNITAMQNGLGLKDIPIIESLGYVFVPLLSLTFLHEKITLRMVISIILILLGVVIFYI